jgi:acyl-CoA thioesterase-2
MGDLAADTEVQGASGRYFATLSRDWEIWGPNGGYIASIALRGAGVHTRMERPASIVGHFLGVASFDTPLQVDVTTLRSAKRAESMRVSLHQDENPIFEALVWSVADVQGLEHDFTSMPERADPERIPTVAERLGDQILQSPYHKFWSNFDERVPDEDWISDWENRPPRDPVAGHWFRYVPTSTFDDPWVDACRSLILVDTMGWPAVCQLHLDSGYMAPSIDIACGFHNTRPEEPWLWGQAISPSAANGLAGCEARVWSRDGALLAHGTSQLLFRPAPPRA